MEDRERLVGLLEQAAAAHHAAFEESDGEDPDWPLWYAEHLQPHLGPGLTVSETVHRLVAAELDRRAAPDARPWPELYAERLAAPPEL